MNYQWYPGHMTKARRMMQEDIRLIDLVVELVDARVPLSSRNPDIDELGRGKARLVLLNKADLADADRTDEWEKYFRDRGCFTAVLDARSRVGMKTVSSAIDAACREKKERDRRRGIVNRPVRAMITGIPNVGKSTFINTFAGKACARTGNRPGVTKGKQWIRLNREVEMLDTPGILWPKFEDQMVGLRLAVTGAIRDEILQPEELALWLIGYLSAEYPGILAGRYQIDEKTVPEQDGNEAGETPGSAAVLADIAKARGCLRKGGEPDYQKAAQLLIEDFRSGRLGRITLEAPVSEKQV